MKQSIGLSQFTDEFMSIRPNNFSYEGLSILFDYLEEYEQSCGTEIELDVIALCCDFSEEHYLDIANSCDIDLSDCDTDEDKIQAVKDHLNEYGHGYCGETDDGSIVYHVY